MRLAQKKKNIESLIRGVHDSMLLLNTFLWKKFESPGLEINNPYKPKITSKSFSRSRSVTSSVT